MSDEDWKGWYQNDRSGPSGSADPGYGATHDRTVASAGGGRYGSTAASGWPSQPPPLSGGSSRGSRSWEDDPYQGGYQGGGMGGGRQWRFWGQPGRRGRRIALIVGAVLVALILVFVSSYFWLDGKLDKSVSLPAFTGQSAGTNWLIVGSDSRQGLSRTEDDALHLGTVGADASDSLMLLHMGSGKPVLLSIPRDSYVPIPGHGMNKINAALAFGGPTLLAQTVEQVTGLRIDHYMGIGFGGLVSVVNTVGGVRVCLPTAIQDAYSGVNLSAGCHNLNGAESLAFVRDRHSFATSDLQRIQDQRYFLKALLSKATSPGVYLNPFTAYPFASTAASSMAVDKGTSLYDLAQAAMALRGPLTGTVPIANPSLSTPAGDAVEWNRTEAVQLFSALQNDKPVPSGLLSGTTVG